MATAAPESPEHDAEIIHKAIKGAGTDEKALISVLGHRTKAQCQLIAQAYHHHHKESLVHALAGDTSYNFRELLCWRVLPPVEVRQALLNLSTKGAGTAEKYLVDVLAPASNAEVIHIYQHDPQTIANVLNDVSHGNFSKVIRQLLKGERHEFEQIDEARAAAIAEQFFKAGEGKLGTDETVFNEILTTHGPMFLERVNAHYMGHHKHTLETAIKKETSGHYQDLLVGLTKPPLVYYADRLYQAMHGLGTDERALNFIFGILDLHELNVVKQLFEQRHGKKLETIVKGDTSGHYEDLLVALLHN